MLEQYLNLAKMAADAYLRRPGKKITATGLAEPFKRFIRAMEFRKSHMPTEVVVYALITQNSTEENWEQVRDYYLKMWEMYREVYQSKIHLFLPASPQLLNAYTFLVNEERNNA